jgi:hypothetical protein
MYREESDAMRICDDCGAIVDSERGRGYAGSGNAFLCLECARNRGGTYDELRDSWVQAPKVGDLIDRKD